MTQRAVLKLAFSRGTLFCVVGLAAGMLPVTIGFLDLPEGHAQSPVAVPSPLPKEGKLEFEVASVRQNKTNDKASMNVDPTPGDNMIPTGGLYSARNIVLVQYISFAYKLTYKQLQSVVSQMPWTAEDRFDIEARAEGNPTKDQYRAMMRALLADRFKLAVHTETREVPIYGLVLATPGKLGPQLRMHPADDPVCAASATAGRGPIPVDAEGFPEFCGGPFIRPDLIGILFPGQK